MSLQAQVLAGHTTEYSAGNMPDTPKKKLFPEPSQDTTYRRDGGRPLTDEDSLIIYDPRAPKRKLLND